MKEIAREDVAEVRESLGRLCAVVAEVDRKLRYIWIDNPHPDFDPRSVLGKRDDELLAPEDAAQIMSVKEEAFVTDSSVERILYFPVSSTPYLYRLTALPIRDRPRAPKRILTIAFGVNGSPRIS